MCTHVHLPRTSSMNIPEFICECLLQPVSYVHSLSCTMSDTKSVEQTAAETVYH